MPRLYCPEPLAAGREFALPPGPARHAQVLRLQPGTELTLFDGRGGEWRASITRMGRSDVEVAVLEHVAVEREAAVAVHLAVGMPAADRMDWLVEKATELGAASIQPLVAERSVLRLAGERADRKQAHWQAVAVAACEQCGRNRVPTVHPPLPLASWLRSARPGLLLSPAAQAAPAQVAGATRDAPDSGTRGMRDDSAEVHVLSGPEGGLSPAEEQAALAAGWRAVRLGPRVLRAETAPLAMLALLTLGP